MDTITNRMTNTTLIWRNWRQMNWPLLGILSILVLALLGDQLGFSATAINPDEPLMPLFSKHWLGSDELGRDILARLALGAKISLLIGLSAACLSVIVGTLYGALSALIGGWVDSLMMRIVDMLYSLPFLMIVVLLSLILNAFLKPLTQVAFLENSIGIISLISALAFFSWPDAARIVRGQVLKLKEEEFIEAAHSLGGQTIHIILKHILPNLYSLMILSAMIAIPRAILTESTLSFIGLGVNPPWCTWGTMISDGWSMIRLAPRLLLLPSLLLALTIICLNQLAQSAQERPGK